MKSRNARVKRARKHFLGEKRRLRSSGQPRTALYSSSSDSHLSVSMASLSSSDHSADSNADTLSTYSGDSHNSQDTNSSQTSDDLEEDVALMELDGALEIMPELVDMDVRLFDEDEDDSEESEDDSDESGESDDDSGNDADNEEAWVDEVLESYCGPSVAKRVRKYIEDMYSTRYEESRDKPVPHPPAQMPHVLKILKVERPDHFREILRVTPYTFDKLREKIEDDSVFFNKSNNPQIPVEEQLAITLYRFGHDGNAASQASVGRWAGTGKGSPALHTKRVMTAVLRPPFMNEAVRLPTPEEKIKAKDWVEAHLCRVWRHGWIFVDGTLIPLFDRPHWYGESYFDRKCNYSLNIQVQFTYIFSHLRTSDIV